MILDDLFEQRPLPAHIKTSDLPPGMRPRLTMRDVERERPRGAYRYRVIPGTPGESPRDFLDLPGAEQYAQATRGRVQPLEEQADDPDIQRGMINLNTIEKQLNTNMKVMLQNETGQPAYQIELPVDKQWLITHAQEWIDAGKGKDLYKLMGTNAGFEFLLAAWQKEDVLRDKRARDVKPEEPDLFGASQAGSPKSPRYQDESQHDQKKNPDITEAPQGARGRTERMMSQMRARQPQATSDLEALAYELQDAERRDAEEITKLEREVDSLETDIKSELQKRVATLTRRKGGVQQAAAADTKIDATLDQLVKVNDQQQRDIDDLTRAVASLGTRADTVRPATIRTTTQPAPAVQAQPDAMNIPRAPARATQPQSVSAVKPPDLPQDTSGSDLRTKFSVGSSQDTEYTKAAEGVAEGWWQQFKGDVKTVAGLTRRAIMKDQPQPPSAKPSSAKPSSAPEYSQPIGFGAGDMWVKGPKGWVDAQTKRRPADAGRIATLDKMLQQAKQTVAEKKKPVPTNPGLWSRAKSAARSKFDVYPSAYANAWAAKWYKSKGGGWRMGKPKKK